MLCFFCLTSCISSYDLKKQSTNFTTGIIAIDKLNDIYKNQPDSSSGISLWTALRDCKTFRKDTTKFTEKAIVSLFVNNKNKMTVRLIEDDKTLSEITLKIKINKDYISVKRNLRLIPIPFFFFVYHEAKTILYIQNDSSINLNYSRQQFLWVLFAGSVDQKFESQYKKVNK